MQVTQRDFQKKEATWCFIVTKLLYISTVDFHIGIGCAARYNRTAFVG